MYQHFDFHEIKPEGWLRRQLEIQAAGLSGNLDKIWPDVRDSAYMVVKLPFNAADAENFYIGQSALVYRCHSRAAEAGRLDLPLQGRGARGL